MRADRLTRVGELDGSRDGRPRRSPCFQRWKSTGGWTCHLPAEAGVGCGRWMAVGPDRRLPAGPDVYQLTCLNSHHEARHG